MISDLKHLLNKYDDVEESDLKQAAYALLSHQFLYRQKGRHRKHFEIINRFQPYFYNLMETINFRLVGPEERGFVGILPLDYGRYMKLEETLVLFSLRFIYDEEINNFKANDDGSVDVAVDDYEIRYEQFSHRHLPRTKADFERLLAPFIQYGVIEYGADETTPEIMRLRILPSIATLLTGDVVKRIEVYLKAADIKTDLGDGE